MPDPRGDFQTPKALALDVWHAVEVGDAELFIEPTVGEGTFLSTVPEAFAAIPWLAWDIDPGYVNKSARAAEARGITARVEVQDAFALDAHLVGNLVRGKSVLAVGNPPWVTSAAQSNVSVKNLPNKSNRFGLRGLDARTGKANFDIAEAILLQLLDVLHAASQVHLAFLVKRSVALKMSRDLFGSPDVVEAKFSRIDARRHFNVSVEAGLFELTIRPGHTSACTRLSLCPRLGSAPDNAAGLVDGRFVTDLEGYAIAHQVEGSEADRLNWRQGIKHDLAKVLELRGDAGNLVNGLGEPVEIEPEILCPLYKSSDVATGRSHRRWFPLYQHDLSGPLSDLTRRFPKLAAYLEKYQELFRARQSSIYRGKPDFMLFGVGEYSLAPFKVAVSGFYKTPRFRVLEPDLRGNPPLVDDTCYLLPFESLAEATSTADYLNSAEVSAFLGAVADPHAKRPFTKEILSRIGPPPASFRDAA